MTFPPAGPPLASASSAQLDPSDPWRHLVYAAEDAVSAEIGPALRRWTDVEAFLESVLVSDHYQDHFPDAPLDVELRRRSRSARASLAVPANGVILVRDGSWDALTVLHELAHLVAPDGTPHGRRFVEAELELVRGRCGIAASAALRHSFVQHGLPLDRPLAAASGSD